MDIKIKSLILWPKNPANQLRRIDFRCKGVEVISGWSEKGKSSIIHIVDYCLGSDKCLIPIGKVRENVAWFGVLLALPKGEQILCARKNPGDQQESQEMHFAKGKRVLIPDMPSQTDTRDGVKAALNLLAGLPSKDSAENEGSEFDGPPSFRDMAAFNFQPQHIVANPNTLFFKADTWTHREKLVKSVLPYVLGAVDAATLDLQVRLRTLEGRLKVKREELDVKQKAMARAQAELRAHFRTAQTYDLVDQDLIPDANCSIEWLAAALADARQRWRVRPHIPPVSGVARKTRAELAALRKKQDRLIQESDDAQRQLAKLRQVNDSVDGYSHSLDTQVDRLAPVGWLEKKFGKTSTCPLCNNSKLTPAALEPLRSVARRLSESKASVAEGTSVLTLEIRRLEEIVDVIDKQLEAIEIQIRSWEERSAELRELGNRRDFINSFIGRVGADLAAVESSGLEKLQKEVRDYETEVAKLEVKVDPDGIRKRMDSALNAISKRIGFYASLMEIGHSKQQWYLDDKNLTLVARGKGRKDHLWEIGSAANWMGYHVAALLALHEYFRTVRHSPVPKFIVFDQPSQAYFPEGLGRKRGKKSEQMRIERADDLSRLKRLFVALSEAIDRTKFGLQIILLEHAEPRMWKGIPHFSMPDKIEWREEGALIPLEWKDA